jgi:hypothetical protein
MLIRISATMERHARKNAFNSENAVFNCRMSEDQEIHVLVFYMWFDICKNQYAQSDLKLIYVLRLWHLIIA